MISVATEADMRLLGSTLAGSLTAGDVVALSGPLGAGKTTLVRGLAAGLGVEETVSSPTFVIARNHPGPRVALQHCDAYRLGSAAEFDELDLDTDDCVTVVEWGDEYAHLLSPDWLAVSISRGNGYGSEERTVSLTGFGPAWPADRVAELAAMLANAVAPVGRAPGLVSPESVSPESVSPEEREGA